MSLNVFGTLGKELPQDYKDQLRRGRKVKHHLNYVRGETSLVQYNLGQTEMGNKNLIHLHVQREKRKREDRKLARLRDRISREDTRPEGLLALKPDDYKVAPRRRFKNKYERYNREEHDILSKGITTGGHRWTGSGEDRSLKRLATSESKHVTKAEYSGNPFADRIGAHAHATIPNKRREAQIFSKNGLAPIAKNYNNPNEGRWVRDIRVKSVITGANTIERNNTILNNRVPADKNMQRSLQYNIAARMKKHKLDSVQMIKREGVKVTNKLSY